MGRKPLIVGIDPGNTSAVAALNLDGEIELLESRREFPREQIIQELVQTGKPVVVASDREQLPSSVEKIAQSMGSRKFTPEEDLGSRKKKQLGSGENSHEVDALASARHAFNSLSRNIRKIHQIAEREDREREEVAQRYFSKPDSLAATETGNS